MQGTLIALAALSDQQQQIGMLRSAGLLSPIAFLDKMSSPLARAAADVFLAEVSSPELTPPTPTTTTTNGVAIKRASLLIDSVCSLLVQALYCLGLSEFDPTG